MGFDIDEAACAVFTEGQFQKPLGHCVYKNAMTDFETQNFTMTEPKHSIKGW